MIHQYCNTEICNTIVITVVKLKHITLRWKKSTASWLKNASSYMHADTHTHACTDGRPTQKHIASSKFIKKSSTYSITERRVPELIPVLGSQPAGDANHKPGCRLPLLSARPAVTPATLKRAGTNFYAW